MKRLFEWLSSKNWIYNFAVKLIANRIIRGDNSLTPEYLKGIGWVKEGNFWVEPRIKGRDKIWVEFEKHYYRVYHSENRTFVALQSKLEWFEIYYLMINNRGLYDLAGI